MELSVYLEKLAKREYLKEFNLYAYFTYKVIGYSIKDDSITVYIRHGKEKKLEKLPCPIEYFLKCHKTGYHIDHRSSKKPVKKMVYEISVYSISREQKEELTIRTTNENIYDYIERQYDALNFITEKRIAYGDKSISMKDYDISGMGRTQKKVKFKNIIEYANFKEEVTATKESRGIKHENSEKEAICNS